MLPQARCPALLSSRSCGSAERQNAAESTTAEHLLFVMGSCYRGLGLARGGRVPTLHGAANNLGFVAACDARGSVRMRVAMLDILVRRASDADLEHLIRLCSEVQGLHAEQLPARFRAPDPIALRREFGEWIGEAESHFFVAQRGDEIVGYVRLVVRESPEHALCFARRYVYLDQIDVTPSERGRGVGDRLMAVAKAFAREMGADEVELNVWVFNARARRFFEKHGFDVAVERRVCTLV